MEIRRHQAVIASLFLLTGTADAVIQDADKEKLRNLDNRVTALEQKKGMSALINPPAGPRVKNGADIFLSADIFYWKAQENGDPIARVSSTGSNLVTNSINLEHRWDLGFRVGLGYNLPHDGWDLSLSWLRFKTRGEGGTSVETKPSDVIYASQISEPLNPPSNTVDYAYGRYRLLLNQFDLDLGRNFFVSKWLAMRPHMGLRTDWIPQKQTLDYRVLVSEGLSSDHVYDRLNYWGIGPCEGLDTEWGIGSGFSIYGNAALAILYGFFKDTRIAKITTPSLAFETTSYSFQHVSRAIADLEVGFRWDRVFLEDQLHLQIQAGWEQHIYFGLNQFAVRSAAIGDEGKVWLNQGDLTMQGFTLSVRVDF